MKKFKCTVTRVDEYEIEFNEDIINEEFMEHYKKYFADYDTLEEHAENIAQFRARFGERFIEGYGSPLVNGKIPWKLTLTADGIKEVEHGININVISEDSECEVEVVEV